MATSLLARVAESDVDTTICLSRLTRDNESMGLNLSEDKEDKGAVANAKKEDSALCCSRTTREQGSILLKLSEDERDKVIVAYAMLPLKDDDRPVDSWKG